MTNIQLNDAESQLDAALSTVHFDALPNLDLKKVGKEVEDVYNAIRPALVEISLKWYLPKRLKALVHKLITFLDRVVNFKLLTQNSN